MATATVADRALDRFARGRNRGSDFILGHMRPDGTVENSASTVWRYWGVPIALMVAGHSSAASRFLGWIRENVFTPDGDFGTSADRRQESSYPYQNSWLIEGAHRLGQFDLSQRGMDFIAPFQDPESGGFYSSFDQRNDDTEMEIYVTSGCGRAAVYTNRLDVARGVGRFLRTVLDEQPDYPRKLYAVYTRGGGLVTEFDPADSMHFVMSQDSKEDQQFFNPGIAGGFLARLYKATGEAEWLELAKRYMHFGVIASDHLVTLPTLRQGKTGWGAAVLYTLTGEAKYADLATRIGDSLLSHQNPDGSWSGGSPDRRPSVNLTAEMVIWLDEISQSVGHLVEGR